MKNVNSRIRRPESSPAGLIHWLCVFGHITKTLYNFRLITVATSGVVWGEWLSNMCEVFRIGCQEMRLQLPVWLPGLCVPM